jgi:tetratricopeptide (TPR) repeat protein
VFKNRYSLFNDGQTWDDSSQCGSNYLVNIIGKSKKFNLKTVQKTLIHNGDSNQFDITTLTTLLLNTERPKKLNKTQIQQLNNEDQLLIELRETRNTLAHHPSKSIDNKEFHQFWSKLVLILVAFGEVQEELDKLKSENIFEQPMQSINEPNVKEILRLNSLGTQAHKEEKFSDAITLFTKAIDLKDVSNHYRAIVYSNMSASRLALYDQRVNLSNAYNDNSTDQRYHALRDAKQARMLSSTSWQGHYRVGKAYSALSEHEKAINSYERALALDPKNTKIQEALTDSRQIQCQLARHDHLDPRGQPVTMQEHLNEMKQKFGIDSHKIRSAHNLLE